MFAQALAKRKEAEGADRLAGQMRNLLENHQRALEEKDAAGKLEQCNQVMHKIRSLVMDVSLKATTEAKLTESLASKLHTERLAQLHTESLASKLHHLPMGDGAKARTRPRRRGRLDPKKFESERGPEPNSPPPPEIQRKRRKSQTYHFKNVDSWFETASPMLLSSVEAKEVPMAGDQFSNGIGEGVLQPIKEIPSPTNRENKIQRSSSSPDLLASSVSLDSSARGKFGSSKSSPINDHWTAAKTSLPESADCHIADQAAASSSSAAQARLGKSCERLVQEAMRQVDASSEIQRMLESTKRQSPEESDHQQEK